VDKYGTVGEATDYNITRRMRFACWINKATNTHSQNVTLFAVPLEHWLHERASLLRSFLTLLLLLLEHFECVWLSVRTAEQSLSQTLTYGFSLHAPPPPYLR